MMAPPSPVETLVDDLLRSLDPVRFAEGAGIRPDAWQAAVLRSTARQQILNCSRQSGKSTVSAVTAVHEAVTYDHRLILVLSPSLRQSQELFRKMTDVYAAVGETVPASVENRLTLELENGSRIVSLPGKEATIRGFSAVSTLIVDEASRVDDRLYDAIRPMMSVSGGRILLLSTPWGRRGFFYREWTDGGTSWHRTKITAHDVPRIDPAWLAGERRRVPRSVFEQEYEGVFGENEDAVFAAADIEAMVTNAVAPLFPDGKLLSARFREENDHA